ncbi:dienelactone hydrolase family protein [Flavobacteriaceae bacterium M23B6Z8]
MKYTVLFLVCVLLLHIPLVAQDTFAEKLSASPRHHEWVTLEDGDRELYAFVAYPEIAEKAKVVIVIHENRGLNSWARLFTDQLAAKGFIAIAPDLLSNVNDSIAKTTDFSNSDEARSAIYGLDSDRVTADLNLVFNYAKTLEAANGEVSVVGFCWGGSQSFRYATNNSQLEEAIVFYGTAPKEKETLLQIEIPVFGFYGGNDNRVNATIEPTKEILDAAEKTYTYEIYEGAGHAFMRRAEEAPEGDPNKIASDKAWKTLVSILKK